MCDTSINMRMCQIDFCKRALLKRRSFAKEPYKSPIKEHYVRYIHQHADVSDRHSSYVMSDTYDKIIGLFRRILSLL